MSHNSAWTVYPDENSKDQKMDVCWRLHLLFSNRRKLYRYVISGKVLSPQNDFQQAYTQSDKFEMVVNSYRKHVKWPLLTKTAKNHPFRYIHLFPLCTFHHFLMSHLGISIIPCLSIRLWCNMWTVESEGERGGKRSEQEGSCAEWYGVRAARAGLFACFLCLIRWRHLSLSTVWRRAESKLLWTDLLWKTGLTCLAEGLRFWAIASCWNNSFV